MLRRISGTAGRLGLACSVALLATAPVLAGTGEPFRMDHLFQLDQISEARIAPDGSRLAVVTERPRPDGYYSRHRMTWLVSAQGGNPEPLAAPEEGTSIDGPVWSPDSRNILYRISREASKQLAILDVARGQSRPLQPCEEGETLGTALWTPDGKRILAVCNRAASEDKSEGAANEDRTEDKIIIASRSSLYDDSQAKPLMPVRRVILAGIDSDAKEEVISSYTLLDSPDAFQWEGRNTLWMATTGQGQFGGTPYMRGRIMHRYQLDTRSLTRIDSVFDTFRTPVLTGPDGSFLIPTGGSIKALDQSEFRQTWKFEPLVFSMASAGNPAKDDAMVEMDAFLGTQATFQWVPDQGAQGAGNLYFSWLDRGSNRVRRLHLSAEGRVHYEDLTPPDTHVASFSVSRDGSTIALVQGDANTPNDVYLLDLKSPSAKPRRITRFGDALRTQFAVSEVEMVRWRSADDRFDIPGWLVKPPGYEPGRRYPLILDVHGGPGVAFRNTFDTIHFEGAHQVPPELYAARGYLVLMVNPRGDPGYGREYQEALLEGWEYPTRYDLIEGVKEMVRRGIADPDRLGIAGASYGGWVAAFAITQTDMFKASSSNDPVIDADIHAAVDYRGSMLSNYWLMAGFAGDHILDKPAPAIDPRKVNTPILLRFGLKSGTSLLPSAFIASGLEYFTYLHSHCKPVEMILHPEEGHGVFDGKTWQDYIERNLAWFDYWVLGKGELPYKPHTCHP